MNTRNTKTMTKSGSRVTRFLPGDMTSALTHFYNKLAYETDASDVYSDWQEGHSDFILVDARSEEAYRAAHIPGAINLPHKQMSDITTASLPLDKVMVVYCDGIGCNASTRGAAKLTSLGFIAKELIGGIDWWKRDGYPVENQENTSGAVQCGCD